MQKLILKGKSTLFEPDTIVTIQVGDIQQSVLIMERVGRTKFLVKDIERGSGWDEQRKKYVGIKVNGGWMRGQNYEYGRKFEIHKKQIIKTNN